MTTTPRVERREDGDFLEAEKAAKAADTELDRLVDAYRDAHEYDNVSPSRAGVAAVRDAVREGWRPYDSYSEINQQAAAWRRVADHPVIGPLSSLPEGDSYAERVGKRLDQLGELQAAVTEIARTPRTFGPGDPEPEDRDTIVLQAQGGTFTLVMTDPGHWSLVDSEGRVGCSFRWSFWMASRDAPFTEVLPDPLNGPEQCPDRRTEWPTLDECPHDAVIENIHGVPFEWRITEDGGREDWHYANLTGGPVEQPGRTNFGPYRRVTE